MTVMWFLVLTGALYAGVRFAQWALDRDDHGLHRLHPGPRGGVVLGAAVGGAGRDSSGPEVRRVV